MKAAIFYYFQSGQTQRIAKSLAKSMDEVEIREIKPTHKFPYPWTRHEFFDAFPESRLGLPPCKIEGKWLGEMRDIKVVVMFGQSWFLSPSLPLQAFLQDPDVRAFLQGRKVVFVNGCRNMWLMTMHKVRKALTDMGAEMVGHIVLQDDKPNLVSVLTVVRWLFYGKQERAWLLPRLGVSPSDIDRASRFGEIINQARIALWRTLLLAHLSFYKHCSTTRNRLHQIRNVMTNVYITKAAGFLPNSPVDNDHMEENMGKRDAALNLAQVIRMLEEIGTGGAGFRFIYGAFLQEAAEKTGIESLNIATYIMR